MEAAVAEYSSKISSNWIPMNFNVQQPSGKIFVRIAARNGCT
jgi:hypothetical protein